MFWKFEGQQLSLAPFCPPLTVLYRDNVFNHVIDEECTLKLWGKFKKFIWLKVFSTLSFICEVFKHKLTLLTCKFCAKMYTFLIFCIISEGYMRYYFGLEITYLIFRKILLLFLTKLWVFFCWIWLQEPKY